MTDIEYMTIAIEEAKKGIGFTNPNPIVGAVIVKNGSIIGKGYHEKYGELHAERNALKSCSMNPSNGTLYVTLEPCCHYGKTPPCTEAIINSGISKVVIGSHDPNPLVHGKSAKLLADKGIQVIEGFMEKECDNLNQVFFQYITSKLPYVVMKYAMTIDGKIATYTGDSKWITGDDARKDVHFNRHKYSGVMVGLGTIIKDNPLLTCRIDGCKSPTRIICDTYLKTPLSSNVVVSSSQYSTIILTCCTNKKAQLPYIQAGCKIIECPSHSDKINLSYAMKALGQQGIDSIILEGGATLNWSAIESNIVNKVQCYVSPKVFGGALAISPIGGQGFASPSQAMHLENVSYRTIGEDLLIEGDIKRCLPE